MGSNKPKAPSDDVENSRALQDYPGPTEEDKYYPGPRRRKYSPVEPPPPPPPTALDQLTDRDRKLVATLVKKYGAKAVIEAVKSVPPARRRGRPRRGDLPRFERIHLADFFDELVEEHREAGSRQPKQAAMRELFDIAGKPGGPAAFKRFAATSKRKLPQGRRDLKRAKETAERLSSKKTRE